MNCPSCGSRYTAYNPNFDEWECKSCDLVWPETVTEDTDLTETSLRLAYNALSVIPEPDSLDIGCMVSVAQYLIKKAYREAIGVDL